MRATKPRFMGRLAMMLLPVVGFILGGADSSWGGPVLIINGASGTSEPGTTASITTQLTALHTAVGNTVTVVDTVPGSLAGFQQVWDIRFSNNLAITPAQEALFLSYLQGGGGMFVMGENSGFTTRNNSVLSLITAAGGGSMSFVSPNSTQTVLAPFTGPNAVSQVTYAAPGGVGLGAPGTGQFITVDVNGNGTGVAWAKGTLGNALAGALTTIFDVNFLQTTASANEKALAANLVGFVGDQVNPVPEPSTLAMSFFGAIFLAGAAVRRHRRAKAA